MARPGARPSSGTSTQPGFMALLLPDLVILLVAVTWALAFAAILAWINVLTNMALILAAFWIIWPVGALFWGTTAGMGYFVAARLVQRKPGLLASSSVYAVMAASYLAIFYISYRGLRESSTLPFREFLDGTIRSIRISTAFGPFKSSGPLGLMGYQLWILDLVAYVFGGFMASAFAGARVACDRCRRFLSTDSATVYGPVAVHAFPAVRDLVRQGQGAVALDAVRAIREPESDVRMRVAISTCGRCARQLYDVAVSRFSIGAVGYVPLGRRTPPPQRWRPVAEMKVAGAVDLALHGVPVPVFTVDPAASADHHADARH